MCGLTGFLATGASPRDPAGVLDAMVTSLEHRGPDDRGTWSDPDRGIFLGFRRLAILDLSDRGHQPMVSRSGRYVLTFNGEIYNFQALREILVRDGFTFGGHSDTEVLLAALERWTPSGAIRRLRGMFAFVLWDREENRLYLGRDRIGIKPLYLLKSPEGIAWASECRAFHSCPLYDGRGSIEAAWHFLQRLYVPGPLSILEGVEKLPAGTLTTLELRDGTVEQVSRERYWSLGAVAARPQRDGGEEELLSELHDLLKESVRLRLVADVPVGAFLSGGIDSTLVVALMQELSSDAVRTFTIRFDDPDFDEGPVASRVAEHLGTRHTSIGFSTSEITGLIPTLPQLSDEPMANPSLLPTLLVSRVARRDVVVALSGDGGDELFGGYNRYRLGATAIRRLGWIPAPARQAFAKLARSRTASALAAAALRIHTRGTVGRQQHPRERMEKLARILTANGEQEAYEGLLTAGLLDPPLRSEAPGPLESTAFEDLDGPLESRMMLLDQLHYLPDDLLAKVDRASMRESLEVRVPLLDQEIVEFSWSLPLQMKVKGGITKWPLRQIAARYVPSDVLERPKMGFTVPIHRWMAEELREWARDTLGGSGADDPGIWDRATLDTLWSRFEEGQHDLALPLYAAAVLRSWSRAWNVTIR